MNEFRIVSSQELNKQFDDLCAQAKSERRGMFALGTAEAVMETLRRDPLEAGEPLYVLKHLELQMRIVLRFPWSIHFSVDEKRRIVYLTRIELLSFLSE